MTCNAAMRPFPNDSVVRCHLEEHAADVNHVAILRDYAYPGSSTDIVWMEDDRRNFHGNWPGECSAPGCTLPSGHLRGHAV